MVLNVVQCARVLVVRWLRAEKLEFSSLRHAKFSTMLLVYALLRQGSVPERFPDTKSERKAMLLNISAATVRDSSAVPKMGELDPAGAPINASETTACDAHASEAESKGAGVSDDCKGAFVSDGSNSVANARAEPDAMAKAPSAGTSAHSSGLKTDISGDCTIADAAATAEQPRDPPTADELAETAIQHSTSPTADDDAPLDVAKTNGVDGGTPVAGHLTPDEGEAKADTIAEKRLARKRSASSSSSSSSDSSDNDSDSSQELADASTIGMCPAPDAPS